MTGPDSVACDMALTDAYIALQSELPQPTLYTASALTISAGAETFSLPVTITSSGFGTGTVEYAGQVDLRLASNGSFLERKTLDELNAYRAGSASVPLGIPQIFALYEDRSTVVQGRCYPGALAAQACDMFASISADDLRDYVGTGGTEGLDTVTTQLGRQGAAALVNRAAAFLVARMDEPTLKKRGINPAVVQLWLKESDDLAYAEAGRRLALESNGATQRRVG